MLEGLKLGTTDSLGTNDGLIDGNSDETVLGNTVGTPDKLGKLLGISLGTDDGNIPGSSNHT